MDVSAASAERRAESLAAILEEDSPLHSAIVEEEHAGYFRLRVTNEVNLARAFTLLEDMKQKGLLLDYNLSQATLEQIFINFAREQEEEQAGNTRVPNKSEVDGVLESRWHDDNVVL